MNTHTTPGLVKAIFDVPTEMEVTASYLKISVCTNAITQRKLASRIIIPTANLLFPTDSSTIRETMTHKSCLKVPLILFFLKVSQPKTVTKAFYYHAVPMSNVILTKMSHYGKARL